MRNILLFLVLLAGGLAGYLIGDSQGKADKEALRKAVETGKAAESVLQAEKTKLEGELKGVQNKFNQDLAASRKDYDEKAVQWRQEKAGLDAKIKIMYGQLEEIDKKIVGLKEQLGKATGADRDRINREIKALEDERERLRPLIAANACLQTPMPASVFNALNGTGGK